jgi:hypothetical protein
MRVAKTNQPGSFLPWMPESQEKKTADFQFFHPTFYMKNLTVQARAFTRRRSRRAVCCSGAAATGLLEPASHH